MHRNERRIRQWWDEVPVGEFSGKLVIGEWVEPDLFWHPGEVFRFARSNGEAIVVPAMFTDLGSIPGLGRVHPDLTKTGYVHGFLVHDGMFVARDRAAANNQPYPYDCDDAADVLAECLKTGDVVGVGDLPRVPVEPDVAHLIWTAVQTFPAQNQWDRINQLNLERYVP